MNQQYDINETMKSSNNIPSKTKLLKWENFKSFDGRTISYTTNYYDVFKNTYQANTAKHTYYIWTEHNKLSLHHTYTIYIYMF